MCELLTKSTRAYLEHFKNNTKHFAFGQRLKSRQHIPTLNEDVVFAALETEEVIFLAGSGDESKQPSSHTTRITIYKASFDKGSHKFITSFSAIWHILMIFLVKPVSEKYWYTPCFSTVFQFAFQFCKVVNPGTKLPVVDFNKGFMTNYSCTTDSELFCGFVQRTAALGVVYEMIAQAFFKSTVQMYRNPKSGSKNQNLLVYEFATGKSDMFYVRSFRTFASRFLIGRRFLRR